MGKEMILLQGPEIPRKRSDPPSENPGKSSGSPSRPSYNLRRQSTARGDAPQKEEGDSDELSSAADSDEEWSPDLEGSAAADEGEEEEEEDGDEEEEINMATDTGPARVTKEPKVATRSYPCPECGRVFSNSSNMWKHLRIHRKEYPFSCHACGKSYSDPSNLAKHQLCHGGERQYKCSQCPKAFFQRFQLEAHVRRHQGIRAFPCLDCKSSFFSRAHLTSHIKIHTFGKGSQHPRPLLRCTDCDRTFAGSRLLRQHQKRHKHLPCEICGQVFTLKFKYLFHLRSHEGSGESGGAMASKGPLSRNVTSATRNATASTVPRNVAQHSADAAAGARQLTKTPGPAQAREVVTVASGPSLETRPPFPDNSHASTMIQSKPPPMPVSAWLLPVASNNRPERSSSAGRLFSPGSAVVPTGFLQATQAGVWPPNLIQARPFAVPMILVLPNGSAPFSLGLPFSTNPNGRATVNSVRVLDPSTPPAGAKLTLELPGQKIVMAQTCQLCHVEYLGTHHCRASRHRPATTLCREESEVICLDTEEDTTMVHQEPPADLQPPLETQGEHEPVAHRLRQARAQVVHTNQAEGAGSDLGGSSEDEWRPDEPAEEEEEEEEEPPAASVKPAHLHFSTQASRGARHTRRRRDRYMCDVCDKRFVHQRSLKQHMRLHFAFSCNLCSASFLRSEQLSWHMLRHAEGNRT